MITYIQRQRSRAIHFLVPINTNKGVTSLIQRTLQTNHNKLEIVRRMPANVIGNLGHICIIKCGVNLVENEKRSRLVAVGKRIRHFG